MLETMKGRGPTYDEVIRGLIYVRAPPLSTRSFFPKTAL